MSVGNLNTSGQLSQPKPWCESLRALFQRLDAFSEEIPLAVLQDELTGLEVPSEEVQKQGRFSANHYMRNLLHAGPCFHALLICWLPGQRSPIHDHVNTSCGFRVVGGTATESVFDRTPAGHVVPRLSRELPTGSVCASRDMDIHQVSNLHESENLLTLHIYSPPLHRMGEYSLSDTQVRTLVEPVHDFCSGAGI